MNPSAGSNIAIDAACARLPANLPTLIVQKMPGAGGLTASNWFEDLAKPDGSTLYYCVGSTAVTQQVFGSKGSNTICAAGKCSAASTGLPSALVRQLRDAFAKLAGDKEFIAELKKVGGNDADLLLAKDADPVLRQVQTVTLGVQEFVKTSPRNICNGSRSS